MNHSILKKMAVSVYLFLGLLPFVAEADDRFPERHMTFWNDPSFGPEIKRVYCCSSKDGRVVVEFGGGLDPSAGPVLSNAIVKYDNSTGEGTDATISGADVTAFVEFGEIRYALSPKYPGTYDITMEFILGGKPFAIAKFRQVEF